MMAEMIVGIDLGTTNSLIGVMDSGFPVLIADQNGDRLTPSVVHIGHNGETLVGKPAARMRVLEPQSTIYSVKRLIGRRSGPMPDLQQDNVQDDLAYQVVRR